jgi:hypothetical protein
MNGKKTTAYRLLVGKSEGKRPLRKDLGEIGWDVVDWIGLAQDRDSWRALVNAVMNLRVPGNAGKLSSDFTTGGLSSSAQFHRVSWPKACELQTLQTSGIMQLYKLKALDKSLYLAV